MTNTNCPDPAAMPTNGDEPEINDTKWKKFQAFNNCYAYMLDDNSSQYQNKPQPGSRYYDMKYNFHNVMQKHYGNLHAFTQDATLKTIYNDEKNTHSTGKQHADLNKVLPNKDISCTTIQQRMLLDNNNLKFITNQEAETQACPTGYYKGFFAVDPKTKNSHHDAADYHFYRQNPDGTWSHKPGGNAVSHVDANQCPIKNPHVSNRDYGNINYSSSCSFFCVPNNYTANTNIQ